MDHTITPVGADVRRSLLDSLVRAAELKSEWRLLSKRARDNTRLPRSVRLAIGLIARRARGECDDLADSVVTGIGSLDDGALDTAARCLRSCEGCLEFIEAADRTVAVLVRNSHRGAEDGE